MDSNNKQKPKFQAGDIINVQGTGIISRIIRWATDYDYSHTAMICCHLSSGEYMVIEMVAKGVLIRPLSVYKGKKVEAYRVKHKYSRVFGAAAVLATLDNMDRCGYAFHKILYLGFIIIPRRIFRRYPLTRNGEYNGTEREFSPKGIYQVFCYHLVRIISFITLMPFWTSILRFFSKDKWLLFTKRVTERVMTNKARGVGIDYTEFVKIVEEEFEIQQKVKKE
jgi:hypothetical protein